LIEQTLAPGVSVARIALDNGVNTNLLFKWRRDQVRTRGGAMPTMLPVAVTEPSPQTTTLSPPGARAAAGGVIEIELAGARIRLKGAVDLAALRLTLQTLSATSA
jgi:transposase